MSSTHRLAVSVPLMKTKGVRLSKELAFQIIALGLEPVWRAIVKAGLARCPRAKHHHNLARQCKDISSRWRSGRYERKFHSIRGFWIVMVDTHMWFTRLMVDNDESGAVTVDLIILCPPDLLWS
ncbi:hypothetical protein TNCV_3530221 [Trichonephila clavipes]|uniref:Uncharacterized protein n=1 Tax=Trichonephila clavipes TaxID=2585209 RepID=A0A8X6RB98_TRICX|nr:hypothetical protein TNCV_3530221 [Trichonephila clavipes]